MKKIFTFLSFLFFCVLNTSAQDGSLITSFDGDGKLINDVGSLIVTQSDGKILVTGPKYFRPYADYVSQDFVLSRYNSNGTLDNSFGVGGKVITDMGSNTEEIQDISIQGDGKIIVAGSTNSNIALARYNMDGSLDNTFNDDGKVFTEVGPSQGPSFSVFMDIQNNGKIIVGASLGWTNFKLIRYNVEGNLDQTFDNDGQLSSNISSNTYGGVTTVAVQSNGKIIVGGWDVPVLYSDFALIRFNTDGTLDNSFGVNGKVITAFTDNSNDHLNSIAIQSDGKIIAAGSTDNGRPMSPYYKSNVDFALVRYNINGSLDNTFDGDGKIVNNIIFGFSNIYQDTYSSTDVIESILIQSDSKILAIGWTAADLYAFNMVISRYNINGSLDNTFGNSGRVIPDYRPNTVMTTRPFDRGISLAQSNGILYAGGVSNSSGTLYAFQNNVPEPIFLPVKFANIKAFKKTGGIEVSFSNLTESEVVKYNIERSGNGQLFTSIKTLTPIKNDGGRADYAYTDAAPLSGNNLYRIKGIETNGKITYSAVAKVDLAIREVLLTIAPNPVKSTEVGMHVANLPAGNYKIQIFNNSAQVMSESTFKHTGGTVSQTVPLNKLQRGMYYLELNGTVRMRKPFIVQ